ncbi:hypothetical protein ACWV27_26855 (plasmid) [Massilia varians]
MPKIDLTIDELTQIEEALEHFDPSDKGDAHATHRAFFKIGQALGRPWTGKHSSAESAADAHVTELAKDGRYGKAEAA